MIWADWSKKSRSSIVKQHGVALPVVGHLHTLLIQETGLEGQGQNLHPPGVSTWAGSCNCSLES